MYIPTHHLKKFSILFLFLFSIFLLGIKIDQGTYKVKYVIETNDVFVAKLLKNYISNQEYRLEIEGNSLEIYPLKSDEAEFKKALVTFKTEIGSVVDDMNVLWKRSKQSRQPTSEDLSCDDVVKCFVNRAALMAGDSNFNETYKKVINKLRYGQYFNDLTLESWTTLANLDKDHLDFQFKTVAIESHYLFLKKILLALLASFVLSLMIVLIRAKKEF